MLLPLLLLSTPVLAEESAGLRKEVEGPGFSVVLDVSGQQACLPSQLAGPFLRDLQLGAVEQGGVDPEFAIYLSLNVPSCTDFFYEAVSNDIRGIGYAHEEEEELFDRSPDSELEGVVFLNDLPYFLSEKREMERAFLHELGHRWLARVHVSGEDPLALLGRDAHHWSYFLDSGGSPLEGNSWIEEGEDFIAATGEEDSSYSLLDLYLMGLLSPEEVGEIRLFTEEGEAKEEFGCDGLPLTSSSPPQFCEESVRRGSYEVLRVEQIIEEEGEREPSWEAERELRLGFYLLHPADEALSLDDCREFERRIEGLEDSLLRASGGRLVPEVLTRSGVDCADLLADLEGRFASEEGSETEASGCSYRGGTSPPFDASLLFGLASAWIFLRRRQVTPLRP